MAGEGGRAVAMRRRAPVLLATAAIGLAAVVVRALPPFSTIPESQMSASRVVPAVALALGYAPYAGPTHGPIIDFMYGPVSAFAFLPAALASTPSGAMLVAALLNALAFFAPMAVALRGGGRVRCSVAAVTLTGFALLVFTDPGLVFSGITIHADAVALGLAALACAALMPPGAAGPGARVASASCVVLAVWAKQPAAPLVAVLPLFVWARDGCDAARRYGAWVLGIGIAVSFAFAVVFGVRELGYNMFVLLARHPWYGEGEHGRLAALLASLRLLARQDSWSVLICCLLAVATVPGSGGVRGWLGRWSWPLLALAGLAMAPTSILGGAKVGGFLNTHSFTSYFLLGAAMLGLGEVAATGSGRAGAVARAAAVLLVLGLAGTAVRADARRAFGAAIDGLARWSENDQEAAFRYARAHPGEVFFPWHPLASLLAERRLDHNEIGAWNRELGGLPIEPAHWARHLPPRMRLIAFKPPRGALMWLPPANHRHPELSEPVEVPELPGWQVYRRPDRSRVQPRPGR